MNRQAKALASGIERVTGALYVIALILLFITVVLRYLFSVSFDWLENIILTCVIYAVFLGAGAVLHAGRHISIDIFLGYFLPKKGRIFVFIVLDALGALVATFMVAAGSSLVMTDIQMNVRTMDSMKIPMAAIHSVFVIGMALLAFFYVVKMLEDLGEFREKAKE